MKATIDGIYPAVQFHLRTDVLLDDEQKESVSAAIKLPMSGYVNHRFAGSRVIITSTIPQEKHDIMAQTYTEVIEEALTE